MRRLTRRRFLAEALASSAGATLVYPLLPSDYGPLESADADDEVAIDPGFVAGRVVDVDYRGGAATVEDPDGQLRTLVVVASSQTWREGRWEGSSIRVGDCIYARGTPTDTGAIELDRSWSNIDSFPAVVADVRERDVMLDLPRAGELAVELTAASAVQTIAGDFQVGTTSNLSPGDGVHVIAYHLANSPFPIASTIFRTSVGAVAADTPEGDLSLDAEDLPETEIIGADACMIYKGLTTWFCCGNVSGCGRCSVTSGGGACGDCRSDRNHMAWPKISTGCGPFCDGCCISASFPRLSCGFSLSVRNPCTGNRTGVTIKDCGPTVRCSSPSGCRDYRKIKFDLTPCAFSAIGNLDSGIIRCHARVNCGTAVSSPVPVGVPICPPDPRDPALDSMNRSCPE